MFLVYCIYTYTHGDVIYCSLWFSESKRRSLQSPQRIRLNSEQRLPNFRPPSGNFRPSSLYPSVHACACAEPPFRSSISGPDRGTAFYFDWRSVEAFVYSERECPLELVRSWRPLCIQSDPCVFRVTPAYSEWPLCFQSDPCVLRVTIISRHQLVTPVHSTWSSVCEISWWPPCLKGWPLRQVISWWPPCLKGWPLRQVISWWPLCIQWLVCIRSVH